MENKVVKTTNGYNVTLRPFISYPRFIEIQKAFTSSMMIDPSKETTEMQPFSASLTYETQEKLIRYLILNITDKDDKKVDTSEDYLPLPPVDCAEVMEVVDEISSDAAKAFSKKK